MGSTSDEFEKKLEDLKSFFDAYAENVDHRQTEIVRGLDEAVKMVRQTSNVASDAIRDTRQIKMLTGGTCIATLTLSVLAGITSIFSLYRTYVTEDYRDRQWLSREADVIRGIEIEYQNRIDGLQQHHNQQIITLMKDFATDGREEKDRVQED